MKRITLIIVLGLGCALTLMLISAPQSQAQAASDESKVQQGFAIAPVPLNLQGKNQALVGLGSYLVNAVAGCNDCHSCPSYALGHNPFTGGDGQINATTYLAGGVPFGPFIRSKNITPDAAGKPAGLTLEQFRQVLRTGEDPDDGELLQVMPWPVFRNMTDRDIQAIYEYLSTIPHAESGHCGGPGQ